MRHLVFNLESCGAWWLVRDRPGGSLPARPGALRPSSPCADGVVRREPLGGCWNLAFERVAPVRGVASFRGQRNWPGLWWFSRTGEHVGYESWLERDRLMAQR